MTYPRSFVPGEGPPQIRALVGHLLLASRGQTDEDQRAGEGSADGGAGPERIQGASGVP